MGVMRFLVDPAARPNQRSGWQTAYLGSSDGRVFPADLRLDSETLELRRNSNESARLHVAYPVEGFGRPILCTATLREQAEPYVLAVELARGRLGLLRDQLALWQHAGMAAPEPVPTLLRDSQSHFRRAACQCDDIAAASAAADAALIAACAASEKLMENYVRQRLAARRRRSSHLPVLLACGLGTLRPEGGWEKSYAAAFTSAVTSIEWKLVEPRQGEYEWTLQDEQVTFAERNRLIPIAGPLLDFGPGGMPDWLWQWGNDFYAIQSFVSDFVETAVTRYAGRVRLWELATRGNTGESLTLSEEHRLALIARAVEVARQADDELQLSMRIDQPWGEYQAAGKHRLSPLQFADALIRSGVGLTRLTIEIAVGYRPGGSHYRDAFEVSRLIDLWSALGLPLTVTLAFPTLSRRDLNGAPDIAVDDAQYKSPWGEPAQEAWLTETVSLLMAKPAVVSIDWCHFNDAVPHRYPHAGLARPDGSAKPALERLTRLRQSYWQRDREAG